MFYAASEKRSTKVTINEDDRQIIELIIKDAVRNALDEWEQRNNEKVEGAISMHKATCPYGMTILKTKATLTGIVIACSALGGGIGSLVFRIVSLLLGN